jgi:galactan 5-O-arabinofuranosyltransferase
VPYDPLGPLAGYATRAVVAGLVLLGAAVWAWSVRRGRPWGGWLVPVVVGVVAAVTVAGALAGTPYAPGGIDSDQSFRTAAITRYADTWRTVDFTYRGLPAFYPPAYFWVLGRLADLTGLEPWRMAKPGTVAAALLVPLVTYLLWRRLVGGGTAALVAVVPLVVDSVFEPYAWLVLFAIVPWWLEVVAGVRRAGRPPGNPLLLGVVGAVLFLTYHYFFFVAALALLIHLVVARGRGAGRTALVLGVAVAAAAVYWLPLAVSMQRAGRVESLANRWFSPGHADLPLPMVEPSVTGAVALLGLGYLVWTVRRDPLSRGLLVLLAAAYAWYLLGAVAALLDAPLLSFRGKPLVSVVLVTAGVLGLVRLAGWAATRFPAGDVRRVWWVVGLVLVVFAGQEFVTAVRTSPPVEVAHSTPLPGGGLPPGASPAALEARTARAGAPVEAPDPPADALRQVIDERYRGPGQPVLLSDRVDIVAFYPYFGFLQWNAHYAHPASGFSRRVALLESLAGAGDPDALAAGARANPYDPIDVFVLRVEGDHAVLRFAADAFPHGTRTEVIRFPLALFSQERFEVVTAGDYLVAITR